MQNIDSLIERVVKYLRINKVLEGSPVFESNITEFGPVITPQAYWDEYYMTVPYWGDREIEFHKAGFESIDSELKIISYDDVQEKALKEIPDSKKTPIVELGSGSGRNGAGYLAAKKPKAEVILVCKPWEEEQPPTYLFNRFSRLKHTLTFTRGREILEEQDLEKMINGLYQANDINNVTFYAHEVNGSLPHFLQGHAGKDVYLFGHKAPRTLPFIIGRIYQEMDAKYMCISLTAQEKAKLDDFSWKIIQKNLGLTDEELQGFIKSAYDPIKTPNNLSNRYDYKIPSQQRIGVMIKMGIALALAKEVNGTISRGSNLGPNNYNQIDHYVEARR